MTDLDTEFFSDIRPPRWRRWLVSDVYDANQGGARGKGAQPCGLRAAQPVFKAWLSQLCARASLDGRPIGGKAIKQCANLIRVHIGESHAQLLLPIFMAIRHEHRAGQGQHMGLVHQILRKRV